MNTDSGYEEIDTCRRFPRTMGEAFKDASYASSVERYRDNDGRIVFWGSVIAALLAAVVLILPNV